MRTTEQQLATELIFQSLKDYGIFLSDVELKDMNWAVQADLYEKGSIIAREIRRVENSRKELSNAV